MNVLQDASPASGQLAHATFAEVVLHIDDEQAVSGRSFEIEHVQVEPVLFIGSGWL